MFDKPIIICILRPMEKLTTRSFSIYYYDANTGENICSTSIINNTGKVYDTKKHALNNKPDYSGLVLWDIEPMKEAE